MKLVVMAYHNIGYVCLEKLIALGADIRAVVTHADNPRETIWFRSVRDLAFANYLPVYEPPDVNDPRMVEAVRRIRPDIIFSFYFRQIIREPLLAIPRVGAFNLHGSLLPRYRGRCPVNWVLLHGEQETGVTLHRMELKPDRGGIVAQRKVPIEFKDTARTLFDKMTVAAAGLIAETYPLMSKGVINEVAQDHGSSTYFGGRKPEDGEIDWEKGARDIYNLIRAVTHPYPGAFTHYGTKKLFVWWGEPVEKEPLKGKKTGELYTTDDGENVYVATGAGAVRLICAQWEGKKKQSGKNLLHALDLKPGDMLRRDTKT